MKSFFFGIKFNLHEMNERKAQRKKKNVLNGGLVKMM